MGNRIAVIKTGGKQYKVKEGEVIKIEKLDLKAGDSIKFDTLLVADTDGEDISLGQPSLGEKVQGKVVSQGKADKVRVVKYKNKTRYLRNKGHRQLFTEVEIGKIG